jgi:hypothetical protein
VTSKGTAADGGEPSLAEHGEIGNGRSVDNIKPTSGGTSARYLVRRLKRDAPVTMQAAGRRLTQGRRRMSNSPRGATAAAPRRLRGPRARLRAWRPNYLAVNRVKNVTHKMKWANPPKTKGRPEKHAKPSSQHNHSTQPQLFTSSRPPLATLIAFGSGPTQPLLVVGCKPVARHSRGR